METETQTATTAHDSLRTPSYIVGIGASAGGLEALERFFDNLPRDTGMAFVVVQHLSPDFKSLMDELLARHTELPIHLVEDGMPVEADHVYLIPPKKEMIISGGRLLLSERDRQQELTLPIDVFFRSLAQDCGPRAVADRAVRRRQRRLARHPRHPRGRRPRHRPGRRQRPVRRHAEDRARRGRRALGAAARRRCRGVLVEHAAAGRGERSAAGGSAPQARRRRWRGRGLPDAPGGVRHRLHPLQAEHGHPPHRAAARARPLAGHRRVRPTAAKPSATSSTCSTATC